MKSRLAEAQRRSLSEAMRRLTPEQRLDAYLVHCRLVMALQQGGARRVPATKPPRA